MRGVLDRVRRGDRKKPESVSHQHAAAIPVAGLTAWQALFDRGALHSGGRRGVRAELHVMSPKSEQLARIAELVASGDVRVEIAGAMPLANVKRAHGLSESGHVRGKLVLTVTT